MFQNLIWFYLKLHNIKTPNIKINNRTIEEKKHTKYLGILIDNTLCWKTHIHHVNMKLSKGIGVLAKLRHYLPKKMLRTLYFAFIQPYINYSLINWGSAANYNLQPIRISIKL